MWAEVSVQPFAAMYTAFCRHVYLPTLDRYRRIPVREASTRAVTMQTESPEKLTAYQVDRLRRLLRHAAQNTRFYRDSIARSGLSPEDIKDPSDWSRLPILEKEDIRKHGEELKSAVFPGRLFGSATSGSTGISLRFVYDSVHNASVQACIHRGRSWWGVAPGAKHLLLLGHPVGAEVDTELKLRLKYRLRNSIEFDTFRDLDKARAREILEAYRKFRPTVIYGYGSGIGRWAEQLAAQGLRLEGDERPVLVEYTADHMFENERLTAESVLGAPVIPQYGARECGGMAAMCKERKLHWSADHALCEIVRADGSLANAGEPGDLVVTPLHNYAMPFLRYRIGDRLAWTKETCTCGVTLPVVQLHVGRTSEIISTSWRQGVSSVVFDFINRVNLVHAGVRGIRQFLVEQTAQNDFVLHVVRDDPFDPRSVEIFEAQTRKALGDGIRFETRFVRDIPLAPTGKRRWYKRSFDGQQETASA